MIDLVNAVRCDNPVTSNRVRAVLSAMFNHGIVLKWIAVNPVNRAVKRFHESNRERYLSDAEFARLGAALDRCRSTVAADVIRLLAWTGARCGGTRAAKWSEFDLERGVWTKPSHHTKQKRVHRVKLDPQAVGHLLAMKARARVGAVYVFAAADGQPIKTIKSVWSGLMRRAQIENFRIHDLRHTFRAT